MWCIVGARESYTRALKVGKWDGFSCSFSMEETDDPAKILAKLHSSIQTFNNEISDVQDWTSERHDLLVQLLEHETMHEGQLIRHIYALKQELPALSSGRKCPQIEQLFLFVKDKFNKILSLQDG